MIAGETFQSLLAVVARESYLYNGRTQTRMGRDGFKLGPTLRLVWVRGQQLASLPCSVDNCLRCAIRPGNRPSFADGDRNRLSDELVHGATLPEKGTV